MKIKYRVYRRRYGLVIQMFSIHDWPWYQASRQINSRKEVQGALEDFARRVESED